MLGLLPTSINLRGTLMDLAEPRVMGILNATPDSFFPDSRKLGEKAVAESVARMLGEGADIIDVGACSTRPGAEDVTEAEEWARLSPTLRTIRREFPDTPLSVDTFRATVARRSAEEFGADIINDISCGTKDAEMFSTVAELGLPYVLSLHPLCSPAAQPIQSHCTTDTEPYTQEGKNVSLLMAGAMTCFAERIRQLRSLGQKDIILDPGFGFGKTLEQNYQLLAHLADLQVFRLPLLIGVSRKSMIYNLLGTTPEGALNGTTAAHAIALTQGANILRAHDVREAKEAIKIVKQCWASA